MSTLDRRVMEAIRWKEIQAYLKKVLLSGSEKQKIPGLSLVLKVEQIEQLQVRLPQEAALMKQRGFAAFMTGNTKSDVVVTEGEPTDEADSKRSRTDMATHVNAASR